MKGRRREAAVLATPAAAFLILFLAVPVLSALASSLTVDTPFSPTRFVGLENYSRLLHDRSAWTALGFTLMFVIVSVTLETLIGLVLALVMHAAFLGRALVRAAVLVPWAVPTVVAAVMWKLLLNDQYGFFNLLLYGGELSEYRAWLSHPWSARFSVILVDVWKTSGFAALLILAGLQGISPEVLEAARVDGASEGRTFLHIMLPLLRPAILLAVLFRTIDAFRVFDVVYVLTQGGPADSTNVLQFYGYRKMFPEQQFGYGSAVSVAVFVLIAAFAWLAVRILSRSRKTA